MPNLEIIVNGNHIQVAEADIELAVGARSTFTFRWEKLTFGVPLGYRVEVLLDGTAIFRGRAAHRTYGGIHDKFGPAASQLYTTVTATDLSNIADRWLVTGRFNSNETQAWSAGKIIRYIRETYLAGDGITAGYILEGRTVNRRSYMLHKASDIFTELADENGYIWWIDEFAQLHFSDRAGLIAPFNLSQHTRNYARISVTDSLEDIRNRQYIRGAHGGFERTELSLGRNIVGQGTQEHITRFPIGNTEADPPEVLTRHTTHNPSGDDEVDFTISTAHEGYTNEGWWYEQGGNFFRTEGELVIDQKVTFTYKAMIPILTVAESSSAIQARVIAEGGSGVYESLLVDDSLEDIEIAQQQAEGLVRRFALAPRQVQYTTWEPGLRAGQIQRIDIPYLGLTGDFIIEKVTGHGSNSSRRHQFLYTVVAREGTEAQDDWRAYFRRMMPNRTPAPVDDDTSLVVVKMLAWFFEGRLDVGWYVAGGQEASGRVGLARINVGRIGVS